MKQVIELLGKTVKFVHTENGHFFEEQGKVTEVFIVFEWSKIRLLWMRKIIFVV